LKTIRKSREIEENEELYTSGAVHKPQGLWLMVQGKIGYIGYYFGGRGHAE